MLNKVSILVFGFLYLLNVASFAETSFLETSLRKGVGVRAMGMGSAFTGVADDATAAFYNPAGITYHDFQYYMENSDYKNQSLERADNYLFQWRNLIVSDWHYRNQAGQEVDVFAYSFGQRQQTGWGFTYKRVFSNFGTDGYTVDFGVLTELGPAMQLGFLAQDLFKDAVEVRTTLRGGFSMRLLSNKLLLAVDEEFYRSPDPTFVMHYGAEYTLTPEMDVRLGWDDGDFTGGISLLLEFGSLDYAIATGADLDQQSVHRVAVCIGRKRNIPALPRPNDRSYRPREAELRRLQRRYQKRY